jgi:hypothetical protein
MTPISAETSTVAEITAPVGSYATLADAGLLRGDAPLPDVVPLPGEALAPDPEPPPADEPAPDAAALPDGDSPDFESPGAFDPASAPSAF